MKILDFVEKFKDEKGCKEYLRVLRMKEGVVVTIVEVRSTTG